MEKNAIYDFVAKMQPTDHVVLFYSSLKDKRKILFTYLKAGFTGGEAGAYVAGEESVEDIKRAMKDFGIEVDELEKKGALEIIDYRDWYLDGEVFDFDKTISRWTNLYDTARSRGFKGLRVTGEMACFFKHDLVKELLDYETRLHKVLELPIAAICAYNTDTVAKLGRGELYLDLIKTHSTVIFAGPKDGFVKSI